MSVHNGKTWGVLEFSHNYSTSLEARLNAANNALDSDIDSSEINISLDMSSTYYNILESCLTFQLLKCHL